MDLTVKIEAGKGGCKHQKVILAVDGKEFTRVMTEEELLPTRELRESEIWEAALPLIRQAAKAAATKSVITVAEAKTAIEAGVFRI
jgi:hypothetical protein